MGWIRNLRFRWHWGRAESAGVRGNLQAAVEHLKAAISLAEGPFRAIALNRLGSLHLRAGRNDDARDCFEQAAQADPGNAECHVNLGHSLDRLGRVADAQAAYERARQISPEHPGVLLTLAMFLATEKRPEEGIELVLKALQARLQPPAPSRATCLNALVQMCLAAKRPQLALIQLEAALSDASADRNELLNLKAIVLSRTDQVDEAVELYREILRADPEFVQAHFNIGMAQLRRQNGAAALESFQAFARSSPGDPRSEFGLGYAHENLRHAELAARHYEEFLRRAAALPPDAEAREALGEFLGQARAFLAARQNLN